MKRHLLALLFGSLIVFASGMLFPAIYVVFWALGFYASFVLTAYLAGRAFLRLLKG